jgi:alpha,alpha-trehalase
MSAKKYFSIESLGALFHDVQTREIFPDSKLFVDCIPLTEIEKIGRDYEEAKDSPGFDLKTFVEKHFKLPVDSSTGYVSAGKSMSQHLEQLWTILKRDPDLQGCTLIDLPFSYIVPGGRFREIYYWDSYFTMLGLQVSARQDIIQNMVDNFAFLIDELGFIPNGNRTYYLGRSQPPFFSLMVKLLAGNNTDLILKYKSRLQKEYDFWMDGTENLNENNPEYRRVVRLPDGSILNRYWDDTETPRPESYFEDIGVANKSEQDSKRTFRNIRAAAESGWDFSSRWFADGETMETIQTTNLLPVDLNCLLLHLEEILLSCFNLSKETEKEAEFKKRISQRKAAIQAYCWNSDKGFYFDYNFSTGQQSQEMTLAAAFPLFFNVASAEQAIEIAKLLEAEFLSDGGLVTTLKPTGQQWDSPNGWAPLQWIAIKGLENYGHSKLAEKIALRWIDLNEKVFARTGKMMEKYNVVDMNLDAGGGEYDSQDGFGWTNGVFLKLKVIYKFEEASR